MKSNYWFKGAIFSTFFVCCIIIILLCASLSTDFWISSTAKRNITQKSSGTINFGLFNGKKVLNSGLGDRPTVIKVVCLSSKCMYSCGSNATERLDDITDLINGNDSIAWDEFTKCKSSPVEQVLEQRAGTLGSSPLGLLIRTRALHPSVFPGIEATDNVTEVFKTEPEFMSRGLWIATIVMMAFAILMVLVAAMFAILNTATNPVETITGVIGLYVWNGIAMLFELLVLVIWGVQFHQNLQHSVLWREERVLGWSTDGLASLNYSYWLVFVAFILHIVNMAVLWLGTHQKRPKKVQIPVERGNANATNMIY